MALFNPIETEEQKQEWINWLEKQADYLNGLQQDPPTREVLQTEPGDLHEFKNMVGHMLATLKGEIVIIN